MTCNVLFTVFCILGCGYQLLNITLSYFEYKTVTLNEFHNPISQVYPNIHLCFLNIADLLNFSAIEDKYDIKIDKFNYTQLESLMDVLTIKDMLDFSPIFDIPQCVYRDKSGKYINHGDTSECHKIFDIKKYLNLEYGCYAISAKESVSLYVRSITNSLAYDRVIYEISLNEIFALTRKVCPTITSWKYPYIDSSYAPSFLRRSEENISMQISCQNMTIHHLGYPFDSFRCQEEQEDYYQCINDCIDNLCLKHFNRLPFTSFYDYSDKNIENIKMIGYNMIKNGTVSDFLDMFYDKCERSCPMYPCKYSFCLTTGHADVSTIDQGFKEGASISIESSSYPHTYVTYVPKVPLLDSIIYILSSLGTWFGLVIISCNPMSLWKSAISIYRKIKYRKIHRQDRTNIFIERLNRRTRLNPKIGIRSRI